MDQGSQFSSDALTDGLNENGEQDGRAGFPRLRQGPQCPRSSVLKRASNFSADSGSGTNFGRNVVFAKRLVEEQEAHITPGTDVTFRLYQRSTHTTTCHDAVH